ncbi:MAG: sulfurtransferase TusA family protein [Candidatus Hodarchaeales archaeon]|jgi:TusA-related sulfurtransferase
MENLQADIVVDITGLQCPVPLIQTRKAMIKASAGQTIEFVGTSAETVSRKEILIALNSLKQQVLANIDPSDDNKWHIFIKKE